MFLSICIGLAAVSLSLGSCFFMEWFVHGPLMHGTLATKFLHDTHVGHHKPESYKSSEHSVRLPWWAPIVMITPIALFTGIISWSSGRWGIVALSSVTAIAFFAFYQYVHMCLHEPVDGFEWRWIKRTTWFARRDLLHRIHHAHEVAFDKPVNLGILGSFWDKRFGTYQPPRATRKGALC